MPRLEPVEKPPSIPLRDVVARVPELAARFRIEKVLGTGGMGVVVAAQDVEADRRVAIKLLREGIRIDRSAQERILREARVMQNLQGNYCVRVYEVGALDDGSPFIVMEELQGRDLAVRLRGSNLAVGEAVDMAIQACVALARAHDRGFVHRDLKPSNIFLCTDSSSGAEELRVKVLDFGVAGLTAAASHELGEPSLTESGQILGSPMYMAPEQIRGASKVDGRVDIWAIGAILYEALSGVHPFFGATIPDTFVRILSQKHQPLRRIAPHVPAGLASQIEACLEKEPARRPADVRDLVRGLAAYATARAGHALQLLRETNPRNDADTRIETKPFLLRRATRQSSGRWWGGSVHREKGWLLSGAVVATICIVVGVGGATWHGRGVGAQSTNESATNSPSVDPVVPPGAYSIRSPDPDTHVSSSGASESTTAPPTPPAKPRRYREKREPTGGHPIEPAVSAAPHEQYVENRGDRAADSAIGPFDPLRRDLRP
jgi:serine/threonine-protein kinase